MTPHLLYDDWGYRTTNANLLGCALLLLLFTLTLLSLKVDFRKRAQPPQSPYSLLTTIREASSGRFHLLILNAAKNVGSIFTVQFFLKKITIVSDADICREILCDRSQVKTANYAILRTVHGQQNDVLTSHGSCWYHARKAIAPAFSSRHIKKMNSVAIKHTNKFISNKLDHIVEEGLAFDVGNEMISLTLDIICETAFEYHIDEEEKYTFLTEFHIILDEAVKKRIPLRGMFGCIIPAVRRARLGTERMLDFALKIIDSYYELESPQKGTVLDCIIKNQAYKNNKARAADILVLLIAGHDTTGYSIAWILIELAKNPKDQAMLRKQLKSVTFEERSDVNMLKNVIKEGLRLHPVVATGFGRVSQKDIIIKQKGSCPDFTISKGTDIMMPNISRHRSEEYYENPDTFKPSRWENPSGKAISALMPFGLGTRNCVGQSLANLEIHSILALICAEYHFSIEGKVASICKITMKPDGFCLKVSRPFLV